MQQNPCQKPKKAAVFFGRNPEALVSQAVTSTQKCPKNFPQIQCPCGSVGKSEHDLSPSWAVFAITSCNIVTYAISGDVGLIQHPRRNPTTSGDIWAGIREKGGFGTWKAPRPGPSGGPVGMGGRSATVSAHAPSAEYPEREQDARSQEQCRGGLRGEGPAS